MQVNQAHFNTLMDQFSIPSKSKIGIGISGGADSLFLAVMLKEWAKKQHITLVALTVNHNLRAEAKQEAEDVARQMKKLKIEHHILTYQGPKPTSRIEEQARFIRYTLFQDFCAKHGISYVCLAHHSDDQAETFFARLTRGSGVDGLAAIRPITHRENLILLRPMLTLNKTDIIDTLKAKHLTWAEDPMNHDIAFERVRWRKQLKTLWQTGLTKAGLLLSAKRLARASEALNFYTDQFIENYTEIDNRGFAKIKVEALKKQPTEIQLRVLSNLINLIGNSPVILSLDAVERVLETPKKRITLGHCHLIYNRHFLFIAKEHARQPLPQNVPAKCWTNWDRFQVWSAQPAIIRAGMKKKSEKDIPYLVQQSFPFFEFPKKLEKDEKVDYNPQTTYIETYINFTPQHKDDKWQNQIIQTKKA